MSLSLKDNGEVPKIIIGLRLNKMDKADELTIDVRC